MPDDEELEQILEEDAKTKSKARPKPMLGPGKYLKGIMMPSDFMPKEQRKAYQESGKVVSYNMYEQVLSYEEFLKIPENKQKDVFQKWRETHGFAQIKRKWDESDPRKGYMIQILMKRWHLPSMAKGGWGYSSGAAAQTQIQALPKVSTVIQFHKDGTGGELANRLMKTAEFLDDEAPYRIHLIIEEL